MLRTLSRVQTPEVANNMKAMILAAGFGKRMRNLTEHTPKPLLKLGKHTLIEHNIIKLAKAGITKLVINVSYLGSMIQQTLGNGSAYGVSIEYSVEDAPLGPGGGIIQALPLLGDQHFILIGADLHSDFPIETLRNRTSHPAHLVMVDNPDFHHDGDFGIDPKGMLTMAPPKLTYGGYSVWHPDIFRQNQTANNTFSHFIHTGITQHAISAEKFDGFWMNIGNPEQLAEANASLA